MMIPQPITINDLNEFFNTMFHPSTSMGIW